MSTFDLLTVDFHSPNAGRDFTASLHNTGFAVVKNHPISAQLIDDIYAEWQKFFAKPDTFKLSYRNDATAEKGNVGYFPFKSENAKHTQVKDLKEFYHYFPWDQLPEDISTKTSQLYKDMNELAGTLLGWVQDNLPAAIKESLPGKLSDMITNSPRTLIRIINYPPLLGDEESGSVRSAAHEDIGMITLLPAATAKGLQVKDRSGKWHDVPCDHGTIVVNTADHLSVFTQGYLKATTHQVVNPEGELAKKPRLSMPLFVHARDEVLLPDGRTCKEYLFQRLKEIGIL